MLVALLSSAVPSTCTLPTVKCGKGKAVRLVPGKESSCRLPSCLRDCKPRLNLAAEVATGAECYFIDDVSKQLVSPKSVRWSDDRKGRIALAQIGRVVFIGHRRIREVRYSLASEPNGLLRVESEERGYNSVGELEDWVLRLIRPEAQDDNKPRTKRRSRMRRM